MAIFVVLLRGINVGGKNLLPMKDFRRILEVAGCHDVSTYIQSGNAVLRYSGTRNKLGELIAATIKSEYDFEPSVVLLGKDDFLAVVGANPYQAEALEPKTVHVWFAQGAARGADVDRMGAAAGSGERFTLTDSACYLHAPEGIGRSKLAARMERNLGVVATARNWRTVQKLVTMVLALD